MMDDEKMIKAREFCERVRILAREYDLPFFVVTDGASSTFNNGCDAVKNARNSHIRWEERNGLDPYENWSSDVVGYINFPECEYESYQKRIYNNEVIYTTRVSSEVGKYKENKKYDSYFGKLKVISVEHFDNISEHPFYSELNEKQINEINLYIAENGCDLVGLVEIDD